MKKTKGVDVVHIVSFWHIHISLLRATIRPVYNSFFFDLFFPPLLFCSLSFFLSFFLIFSFFIFGQPRSTLSAIRLQFSFEIARYVFVVACRIYENDVTDDDHLHKQRKANVIVIVIFSFIFVLFFFPFIFFSSGILTPSQLPQPIAPLPPPSPPVEDYSPSLLFFCFFFLSHLRWA